MKSKELGNLQVLYNDQKVEFEKLLENAIRANKQIYKQFNQSVQKMEMFHSKIDDKTEHDYADNSFKNLIRVVDNTKNTRKKNNEFEISKNDIIKKKGITKRFSTNEDIIVLKNLMKNRVSMTNPMRKSKSTNNIPYCRFDFATPPVTNMTNQDVDILGESNQIKHINIKFEKEFEYDNTEDSNNLNRSMQDSSNNVIVKFSLSKCLEQRAREGKLFKKEKNYFFKKLNSMYK
jgi:hypothetical protein